MKARSCELGSLSRSSSEADECSHASAINDLAMGSSLSVRISFLFAGILFD